MSRAEIESLRDDWSESKKMSIIERRVIMHIILQFHETRFGVGAGQAEMQFGIVGGINVTRC